MKENPETVDCGSKALSDYELQEVGSNEHSSLYMADFGLRDMEKTKTTADLKEVSEGMAWVPLELRCCFNVAPSTTCVAIDDTNEHEDDTAVVVVDDDEQDRVALHWRKRVRTMKTTMRTRTRTTTRGQNVCVWGLDLGLGGFGFGL